MNDGYFNISNNGISAHALTDLTSAPSKEWLIDSKFPKQLLKELLTTFASKQYPITVKSNSVTEFSKNYIESVARFTKFSGDKETDFPIKEFGIFPDYSYSLLGLKSIPVAFEALGTIDLDFVELRCTHGPGYKWRKQCNYTENKQKHPYIVP